MEYKLNCAIVKDLLPNYIEKLTSEETNQEIENHLSECEPCQSVYVQMSQDVQKETSKGSLMEDARDLTRFLNKTKAIAVLKTSFLIMMILGIVVNLIVDLAVNHSLTWSVIVIAATVVAICTYVLIMWGGKNRILKGIVCVSLLAIPLLWIISLYCVNIGIDSSWFGAVAVPVTCIWLVIIWAAILSFTLLKVNFWFATGLLVVLAIPGNIWTNAIADGVNFMQQLSEIDTVINSAAYIFSAIVLFALAYSRRGKRI